MPVKRIGIFCSSRSLGGLELNTVRLAHWMGAMGWDMHLLVVPGSPLHQKGTELGLQVSALPESKGLAGKDWMKAVQHWMAEKEIPVLFIPYNKDLSVAAGFKRFFNPKAKLVYQQHMQVGVSKRDPVHTFRYKMIDAWISPLQYLKAETIEKTRVPAEKIHVVPFGLDPSPMLQSHWTRKAAREVFSLPAEPKMIGVLGRIDPKKGQDLVIRGIHRLQEQYGADYHLLLVGDATLNEGDAFTWSLMELVRSLKLEEKVHFRGFQADIMPFFRAIDVFAMPSHGETYGMVTLEAMAAGVPVAGTDRDGTKEILQEGKFGFLFPKDDVDGFCRRVMEWDAKTDKQPFLDAARQEVLDHYNRKKMCGELEAVFSLI